MGKWQGFRERRAVIIDRYILAKRKQLVLMQLLGFLYRNVMVVKVRDNYVGEKKMRKAR